MGISLRIPVSLALLAALPAFGAAPTVSVAFVPESATLTLFGLGLAGMLIRRTRRS